MAADNKGIQVAKLCLPDVQVPQPVCALLVFSENGFPVVTRHTLSVDKDGPQVGIGAPLAPDDIALLGTLLSGRETTSPALLPDGLLALTRWRMTWVTKACVRPMWFRFGKQGPKRLLVPWPRLIVSVTKSHLHVAAVKTRARPTADTVLYHAPLMNVGAGGSLCLGNARLPSEVGLDTQGEVEAVIYDTAFSHTNHDATLKLSGGSTVSSVEHYRFWRSLAADEARRFPTRCLRSMKRRLGEFLSGLRE